MLRLGFNKYYVQGGDWGALIATDSAALLPDKYMTIFLFVRNSIIISNMSNIKYDGSFSASSAFIQTCVRFHLHP